MYLPLDYQSSSTSTAVIPMFWIGSGFHITYCQAPFLCVVFGKLQYYAVQTVKLTSSDRTESLSIFQVVGGVAGEFVGKPESRADRFGQHHQT